MNKNIIIGGGIIALIGVGVMFYLKNKSQNTSISDSDKKPIDETTSGSKTSSSKTSGSKTTDSTSESSITSPEVSLTRKQKRKQSRADKKTYKSACGRRPILKKKRGAWQECVNKEKAMAFGFDGSFEVLENFDI